MCRFARAHGPYPHSRVQNLGTGPRDESPRRVDAVVVVPDLNWQTDCGVLLGSGTDVVAEYLDWRCVVSHVESQASYQEGTVLDAAFKKLPSGGSMEEVISSTTGCTGGGTGCGVKVGIFAFLKNRGRDQFSLEGVHRVNEGGSEIMNLPATTYYSRP